MTLQEGGKEQIHSPSKRPLLSSLGENKKNTAIFVTGLPEDTTLDELVEYFGKYGVIMDDMFTGGPRVKMYYYEGTGRAEGEAVVEEGKNEPEQKKQQTDGDGKDGASSRKDHQEIAGKKSLEESRDIFKGEALVVYLREESAIMAVEFLDASYIRPNVQIHVERASFEQRSRGGTDNGDASTEGQAAEGTSDLRRSRKVERRLWKQHMQQMAKKLEWTANDSMTPEEERQLQAELARREKYRRIVVLHNMFTRQEYEEDARFVLDLKEDILEECEKLGTVTAIHVLPETLRCTVKFRDPAEAEACLRLMNGRFFAGHRVVATLYDGSFSLKEAKSTGDEERLEKFGDWLEQQEANP